ncbi:MAG: VWA domain-containing protein [Acidobacteria bacterium]|nr:VWA domain-containing protein [Acidobacteriota bacterium]
MTWIILALLALSGLWIGAGLLLLKRGSRRVGTDYRRGVAERVYVVGQEIEVDLRLVAPANMQLMDDHDVLLIIDHSGSMGSGPGSPLREAVRAAENFIRRLPDNVQIGVMGFDHEARLLSPLTNKPRQALRAIGALGSGGGTAIHTALENSRPALRAGRCGVKKTIILLSDGSSEQGPAEVAATKLRQEIEKLTIICVGFGSQVNESLLRSVASGPDQYLHISNTDDLHSLFSFLAATVSGQMAVAGLIDEGARAPHPFRLIRTGGLYPIGVQPAAPHADSTRIVWSIPLMNEAPTPLTYYLLPECPGWHKVAAADSKSTWRMPDGTTTELRAPDGPHVLVMPRWLGWAWPVLNPLFWMLFGRFWPCAVKAIESVSAPEFEPLHVAALPALPPAPQERVYEPDVRPAVVIGLGEVGEWTICRLKERLQDRRVDPGRVEVVAIHVTHRANREPVKIGNTVLGPHEQVEIHQDLRPYLETLRDRGVPPLRHWIPWHRWLSEMQPLTTLRTIADDRRKARLSIIRKPEPVEAILERGLRRVVAHDGVVIVVGSIADAECSGLLSEVAHICATRGAGVTAVFARPPRSARCRAQPLRPHYRPRTEAGNHPRSLSSGSGVALEHVGLRRSVQAVAPVACGGQRSCLLCGGDRELSTPRSQPLALGARTHSGLGRERPTSRTGVGSGTIDVT